MWICTPKAVNVIQYSKGKDTFNLCVVASQELGGERKTGGEIKDILVQTKPRDLKNAGNNNYYQS